ncbi:MAG: 2Fe-2S iron-sulfur cluster-binding protein [bacterium]
MSEAPPYTDEVKVLIWQSFAMLITGCEKLEKNKKEGTTMKENSTMILLVEDDPIHANLIRTSLYEYDKSIAVEHVSSGEECLEAIKKRKKYDAIITEYDLPQKKGIEVAWKVRETYKLRNPLVMLLEARDEGLSEVAVKCGASRCIIKTEHYTSRLPMVIMDCLKSVSEEKELVGNDTIKALPTNVINFTMDGQSVEGKKGETILEVATRYSIKIPTLCYHPSVSNYGVCRLCVVEVIQRKRSKLCPSCVFPIAEGIEVKTKSESVMKARRIILELLMSRCPESDVLKKMGEEYGLSATRFALEEGADKCILCGLCVRVCEEVVGACAIGFSQRGLYREISTPFLELSDACTGCGECVKVCPTEALTLEYINDKIRKKKGIVAVKCDGCAGYSNRACVINCPSGALEDISIEEYLSQHEKAFNIELRELLRSSLAEDMEREHVRE